MQIIVESRAADAAPLRDLCAQRLRFVLRRLTALVPLARVQLSDVNGPRGGVDKRCQVALTTQRAGTVVIDSVAHDWRAALELSLSRASRVLKRSVQRVHKPPRGRIAKFTASAQ